MFSLKASATQQWRMPTACPRRLCHVHGQCPARRSLAPRPPSKRAQTALIPVHPVLALAATVTLTEAVPASTPTAIKTAQSLSFDQTHYKEKARKLVTMLVLSSAWTCPAWWCVATSLLASPPLLERLCGVKLPRAAGTCTKCPTEVRLSTLPPGGEGVTWCCQIKLRREYGPDNIPLDSQPKEEVFKTLTQEDKDNLHFYVSAAQRTLLNPETPADKFVREADTAARSVTTNGSDPMIATSDDSPVMEDSDALRFTRNVIVLEITGADVDLALIDLPGIIQAEEGDDKSNVELVRQLVQQYISNERAIIVATINCKDDIDNQQVVQMAREADPDGHRTIGVLTKVGTIEPGTHHTWLKVLQGNHFSLRLGYYCVVNPSQKDLDDKMTQLEAAAKEEAFFQTDAFFSSQQVAATRERFGVVALRVQLSKHLVALTQRELPKMKQALEEAIAQTEVQLSKLPPPPASDPNLELFRRLRELSATVERAIDGDDDALFFKTVDDCFKTFRSNVLAARPTVWVGKQQPTSSEAQEEDTRFWLAGPDQATAAEVTLERARELEGRYRVKELPTFAPYRVLEELVQGQKGRWKAAALSCLHDVAEELQRLADAVVDEHFGQFSLARQEVRARLYEVHSNLLADTEQRVKDIMEMEREQLWTQNDHYMATSKEAFLTQLLLQQYDIDDDPVDKACDEDEEKAEAIDKVEGWGLTVTGEQLQKEHLADARRQNPTSSSDEALLQLIAGTLAYFKVSSKRVIDGVPMHLRHYLLRRFCNELRDLPMALTTGRATSGQRSSSSDLLASENGGVAEEQAAAGPLFDAAQLMAEDRSTAERRAQLLGQLAHLQGVRKLLSGF